MLSVISCRRIQSLFSRVAVCSSKNLFKSYTFASDQLHVDRDEILQAVKAMNTEVRQKDAQSGVEVKECKLCNKRNKDKLDNLWKLTVNQNGSYRCFRCSEGGSWFDLKRKVKEKFAHECMSTELGVLTSDSKTEEALESIVTKPILTSSDQDSKKFQLPNQLHSVAYYYALFPDSTTIDTTQSDTTKVVEDRQAVKAYLNEKRGLNDEVLQRYGVGFGSQSWVSNKKSEDKTVADKGVWEPHTCITFPWMVADMDMNRDIIVENENNKADHDPVFMHNETPCMILRIKYRALDNKGLQRISPRSGMWGFFGWHTVKSSDTQIIITEGEYDAMAAAQGLSILPDSDPLRHIPVVSLPNGCNSLPTELVTLLQRFTRVYLWMDNDKSGIDAAEKFARKLGLARCLIVKPIDPLHKDAPKDANDALRTGNASIIPNMLRAAKQLAHAKIQVFADLKAQVFASIRRLDLREGAQVESMPALCKLTKGFRKGELVIFTGPTGSGKTTLLSQISLDFARSGAPVLWGSFEIKNHRLVHKMLQQSYQYGALNLISDDKLEQVASDFESLPLQFMNFHGSTAIDQIVDAMEYAVYKDDIQHIIIDNLQFMMPRGVGVSMKHGFEKFDVQDAVIDKFRRFATEKNVNVIVVIHPRKEDDSSSLGISSIFGTAKATQEADLVLILQKGSDGLMSLDVKKNRYDGMLGRVPLDFNQTSLCFVEVEREPPVAPTPKTKAKGKFVANA